MSAKAALELGCSIRGVLSFTSTSACVHTCLSDHRSPPVTPSSDKAGRSILAPGRSALSIAHEVQSKHEPPVLSTMPVRSPSAGNRFAAVADVMPNSSR
jgi:fatty acid synthase subunit alpha